MVASKTHNEVILRPPPGTRFTIWGSDVRLEFERGREREIVNWLTNWIVNYIEPEAQKAEEIAAREVSVNAVNGNNGNPKISKDTIKKLMDDILNKPSLPTEVPTSNVNEDNGDSENHG